MRVTTGVGGDVFGGSSIEGGPENSSLLGGSGWSSGSKEGGFGGSFGGLGLYN